MMSRSYSELIRIEDFEERFQYLSLNGMVGEQTFGFERHMNQAFYRSMEWRRKREEVLARDWGMDLAHPDYPVRGAPHIHHMNPIRVEDLMHGNEDILLNIENLITVSHRTHNAIHYGDASLIPKDYEPRRPGDTTLWSSRRSSA
jgi:hypothetical protein